MNRVPPTHGDDNRPQAWMSGLRSADPGPGFDPSVPHPARVYAYWLGGKDHYPADRHVAEEVIRYRPQVVAGARANRAFLARIVRYLAAECGIRQLLDIGTGLPAPESTHEVSPGRRAGVPGRLCRQRPAGARACTRPADQYAARRLQLCGSRRAQHRCCPRRGEVGAGFHPARRGATAGGAALHCRRRRPGGDRLSPCPAVGTWQLRSDLPPDK
jgi:hypothetical protein